ncbi:MAG: undecaprenyl-phosphate glucose phosphotransferase [Chloroflexi bacterium]|nr:undecaprenyl-phosphate glucose phosphotransferase [Chloroflexota bacterium]
MAVERTARPATTEFPASGPAESIAAQRPRQVANVYLVAALLVSDFAAGTTAILSAYYLRFLSGLFLFEQFHPLTGYLGIILLQMVVLPLTLASNRLYRPIRSVSWLDQAYGIFTSASVATALAVVVGGFLWPDFNTSRLMIGFFWALTIVFTFGGRAVVYTTLGLLRLRGIGVSRVLVVGEGETANLVLQKIRHLPSLGYSAVGIVVEEPGPVELYGLPVLGAVEDVGSLVRQHQIDDVLIVSPTLSHREVLDIAGQIGAERVNIRVFPDLFQIMTTGVTTGELAGLPLVTVKDVALRGFNLVLKRWLDVTISAAGLVLLSPLLLGIALLVKLTSPKGPVFLIQERVGLDGKPFPMIKFRSMRPDAERWSGPVWTTAEDPRRTRLGAFLRRTSLDELPQLINVLVGDMSLVGPRPERPFFVEQFRQTVPRYFERHREKAGMTGWAQVNGLRGNTSIEERTAYDLWYVENWTLWLDIKILLKTTLVAFRDRNAY